MMIIQLKQINKSYGKHKVIDDFHLDVKPGEFVLISGKSGSGEDDPAKYDRNLGKTG